MNGKSVIGGGGVTVLPSAKRSSNFELLRIVCMLLIICGHILKVRGYEEMGDESWIVNMVFYPFCAVAVNVFVLISGFFGIRRNFAKLWSMNWMVTFWSVVFFVVSVCLAIHQISPRKDWMFFVPVLTNKYWFITTYFALCLVSPYLNMLVEHLDKRNFQRLLVTCFGLFVVLPTFGGCLNFPSLTGDAGYGIVNFMFLYLLGRYIRLYYSSARKGYWYLFGYILSMGICSIFQIVYSRLLGFPFNSLISYDTLFVFLGAVCLFLWFRQMEFSSRFINLMAANCLAVYVIHLHPLFYDYFFVKMLHVKDYHGLSYILLLLIAPALIYVVCMLLEVLRKGVFKAFSFRREVALDS